MATLQEQRKQAHAWLDQLPPSKLGAVHSLLEVLIDDDVTEDDREALLASDEYFRQGGAGIPFEQVVADLGFTMDQVRRGSSSVEK